MEATKSESTNILGVAEIYKQKEIWRKRKFIRNDTSCLRMNLFQWRRCKGPLNTNMPSSSL